MKTRFPIVCIVILITLINITSSPVLAASNLGLTPEEQAFIKEHSVITTAIDPEFSPYEFIDTDGVYKGITADYLKLLEIETGLTFDIQKDLTWAEAYDLALAGEIDLLPCVGITKQRKNHFLFSDVYLTYQRVLLSRADSPNYNLNKIDDEIVGVQKNSSHNSYLISETDIEPVLFSTTDDLLKALSRGEIDIAIANYASSRYRIKKLGLTNIKVDYVFDDNISEFGMAINPDEEILVSIINKGLAQITEEERILIQNKWLGIEQAPDYRVIMRNVLIGICIVLILLGLFLYWNYTLQREIKRRKIIEKELVFAKKEADHANSAKSTFLAHMSHEIRTPLNAIIGLAYLLENTKTSTIQAKYISKFKDASYNLLNIINDILDFSKIESGQVKIEHVAFSLDRLLDKVSGLLMPKAQDKGLSFYVKKDVSIPDQLIGDPTRIEQILINFLNNAIKFTSHGEVQLEVSLLTNNVDSCQLKFSVKDTGIGISKDQMDHLFIPFHQLDSSITRKYGGTGLGLSISQNIANLLNGTIGVESELNKGSIFSLTLPLDTKKTASIIDNPCYPTIKGLKVLLVDEDQISKNIIIDYLTAYELNVDTVNSLNEAYYKLDVLNRQYSLLIVELNMTDDNALDLVKHVKDRAMKVIIIAKQIKENQYEIAKNYGVTHLIMKPIISSILYNSIVQCFCNNTTDYSTQGKKTIQQADIHYVLLVEDNEVNQMIEKEILEQKGYHVTVANNGSEAIDFMKDDNNIEIILMDIHMPGIDGYEATKVIRSFDNTVPILAMTAESFSNIQNKSAKVGMNGYITKPVDPELLFTAIESHVHQKVDSKSNNETVKKDKPLGNSTYDYIDIKQGLIRIGNNEKLYYEILDKFYDDTKSCKKETSQFVNNQEIENAIKLVHKIKGTSGNIGAVRLFQSATTLLSALREGIEIDFGPYLWEFENDLNKTLENIESLVKEQHKVKKIIKTKTTYNLTNEVNNLLKDLDQLLSNGDLDAFKVYNKIDEKLHPINNQAWQEVGEKMKNYKFKEAYKAFKQMDIK